MPAAKKRKVGRPRSKSAPAVLQSPRRPKKRRQWTDESMVAALEAVKQGEPILRAARTHGVPRTTLQDRVHGKVTHWARPGPRPYLAPAEEKELSMFIVEVAKAGYGKTRKQIKAIAENVAVEKGTIRSKKHSNGWFNSSWIGILSSHYEKVMPAQIYNVNETRMPLPSTKVVTKKGKKKVWYCTSEPDYCDWLRKCALQSVMHIRECFQTKE